MGNSLQKAFLGVIAFGVSCIAIELVPVSRQAAYWNLCLDSTLERVDETPDLNEWSDKAKASLVIALCNGAVYEYKLKTDKRQ